MLNSRSIPHELWITARKSLVFFFSRRGLESVAEDLANETLMTVWNRCDFEFEQKEDFLKICYGFARKVLQESFKEHRRHSCIELNPEMKTYLQKVNGLEGSEVQVFLDEVCHHAKAELLDSEWNLIRDAANRHANDQPSAAKMRVRLHRARKKLAKLTGWLE